MILIGKKLYASNFRKRGPACIERAGYACQKCGLKRGDEYPNKKGGKSKAVIQAHHVNGDTENPKAELIALCKTCHLEADKELHADNCSKTWYRKERKKQRDAGQLELPIKFKGRSVPGNQNVSYQQQYRKCNKSSCKQCSNGGQGHGPYWYAYWREGSKLRSAYIGKELQDQTS
jgi:hypothetical protein